MWTAAAVKDLRMRLGMGRARFDDSFRLPHGTSRRWENPNTSLSHTCQVLLSVINYDANMVIRALSDTPMPPRPTKKKLVRIEQEFDCIA